MSKSSIYESKWTNLVFENKNKEYGAYQLRQENSKTTITALFMGLLLITSLGTGSMLINKFGSHAPVDEVPQVLPDVITPVDFKPYVEPKKAEPVVPQQQPASAKSTDVVQLTHPIVSSAAQDIPEIAVNTNNAPTVEGPIGSGTVVNAMPVTGGGGGGESVLPTETNEPVNTAVLDKMPEFPGGMAKFYSYVGNNFHKPDLDADRILKVYVSFVIEKDGSITDIVVRNDPGYGLGKEAVRVLKSLKTKWSPGILNGKAVRTAYNLPITIKTEAE